MPKLVQSILDKQRLDARVHVHDRTQERNRRGVGVAAGAAAVAAVAVAAVAAAVGAAAVMTKRSHNAGKVLDGGKTVDGKAAAKNRLGRRRKKKK